MADHETKPFSSTDVKTLKTLKDKALFTLARNYSPFFLGLAYAYYAVVPKALKHTQRSMGKTDYEHVYWITAIFFGTVFLFFLVRDIKKSIIPINLELRSGQKTCLQFYARKYQDPIYGKCLLYYPGKENFYVELSSQSFESITDGENLYMETGFVTGEILLLKSDGKFFPEADEFAF